jgi:hypothetical protein
VAGILFKFVLDRGGPHGFGSDRLAAKEAGHQLKGLTRLQQQESRDIRCVDSGPS